MSSSSSSVQLEMPPQIVPHPGQLPASSSVPSASLYVGELDPTVTEALLFEIFNVIGPVASIRICRDAITRRSLGYAYVNYLNASDGQRALEQLNYSPIKNRACRIMWSQRDPALRKTGQGNIFIKNLDEQIDNKALHDTFAAFGHVLSCKVATDDQGRSKGFGFVHYETAEAAEHAIKAVNGMLLNDKKVFVGLHISNKERQSKLDEMKAQFTNIYVKNIDNDMTQEDFKNFFAKCGTVVSAVISVDGDGKSKGFGFVNFEKHEEAQKAVDELHDSEYHGKKLFVARAQTKAEREEELRRSYEQAKMEKLSKYRGVNLYIKNLEDDVNEDKLRSEFEHFGTVTSCKIMRDDNGASRGFGFVCFSSPDEATKAVAEMNNMMIGSKPLYVSMAQRREDRKQLLESQIAQHTQIRAQQAAMAGIPGGYHNLNGPMYYSPDPGFPPQGRSMLVHPQPGTIPPDGARYPGGVPTPRYLPPQAYNMPIHLSRGVPHPSVARRPGPSMTNPNVPITRVNGLPPSDDILPHGAPPSAPIPSLGHPHIQPIASAQVPEVPTVTAEHLAAATLTEQKQMLGESIYVKIAPSQPELAGKITGMLLEMDNSELLHFLEDDNAMRAQVNEALKVLNESRQ